MPDPSPQPWDRRPGEGDAAYAAFVAFLNLGPSRTVTEAFRQTRRKPDAKQADGTWNRWAKSFEWTARAKARDEHERKIEQAAREKAAAESGDKWGRRLEQARDAAYVGATAIVHECLAGIQQVKGTKARDLKRIAALLAILRDATAAQRRACILTPGERGDQQADEATQDVTADEQRRILEAMAG